MNITIKRLYELSDDLNNIMISDIPDDPRYSEIYPRKIVSNGISHQAFTIRPQTFYEVILSHIPKGGDFMLTPKLSAVGIIFNYNKETKQLFLYNCTQNQIYIEENQKIGDVFNG